ncbi:uncharacterized protein LOC141765410 [Sebastes fasciatus]|uniref:uncharacterized protein LOC141765410 n=1 Tax=Sebastes fasciatus TaxID=394691 RepID=UPI003D9E6E99
MDFIFAGAVPRHVSKYLLVCANHFTTECFVNQGQYLAGYASYLKLNIGSIPTVRDASGDPEAGCSRQPTRPDVACQTDPVQHRSVRTQRTFHPFVRSKGVQATVSCKDFRGGTDPVLYDEPLPLFTSTPAKRPAKRPRLELEEEDEEDALEGSSSFLAPQGLDATYDPEESVTHVTASTDTTGQAPTATHNVNTYIVYESCIMDLFRDCPVCHCVCDIKTRRIGTFLSVDQLCPHCQYPRHWDSQPIVGSTPAGNLQLSTAVYVSGASFFKLQRVSEEQRCFQMS